MDYHTIEVQPIAGAMGAEVSGIDLSKPLGNTSSDDIQQALCDHKAIFLRDQKLTPEDHLRVAGIFGEFYRVPFVKARDDHPDIVEIVKEEADAGKYNFGGVWHSDASFDECPPMGSVLYSLQSPTHGGDTLWTNMEAAYEALSNGMKVMLDSMNAMHSAERNYGSGGYFTDVENKSVAMGIENSHAGDRRFAHPVVRTHPITGRKSLFVNPVYTVSFENMTEDESAPLLNFLHAHATRPEFTCRFRWTTNALAIWDNRCTMHFAINDYDGQRRHMNRVTVAGERPR